MGACTSDPFSSMETLLLPGRGFHVNRESSLVLRSWVLSSQIASSCTCSFCHFSCHSVEGSHWLVKSVWLVSDTNISVSVYLYLYPYPCEYLFSICLFIQKYLSSTSSFAGHCLRSWGHSSERGRQIFCPPRADLSVRKVENKPVDV